MPFVPMNYGGGLTLHMRVSIKQLLYWLAFFASMLVIQHFCKYCGHFVSKYECLQLVGLGLGPSRYVRVLV